jgi:L-threonylcarbamoyladenylate synthase
MQRAEKKLVFQVNAKSPQRAILQQAASVLRRGGLVAFPTETVYGLGADALDRKAVEKIFTAKHRPSWDPLIVHVRDVAMARSLAKKLPPIFDTLTDRFWPGPLTLVVEKSERVPGEVTANRPNVALRMPRHPVAALLLAEAGLPIAAPSANRFGRPSPTRAEHVLADLGNDIEMILDAGPTTLGVESTVLDLTQTPPGILRPGGVTREELAGILGEVPLALGVSDEIARLGLPSPGRMQTHYAPLARVELFEGELDDVLNRMIARAIELRNRRGRVGAIASDEMMSAIEKTTDIALSFGKWGDWERMAKRLFASFRILDAQGVTVILCVLPPPVGMGLAVRDRLLRAAGTAAK